MDPDIGNRGTEISNKYSKNCALPVERYSNKLLTGSSSIIVDVALLHTNIKTLLLFSYMNYIRVLPINKFLYSRFHTSLIRVSLADTSYKTKVRVSAILDAIIPTSTPTAFKEQD